MTETSSLMGDDEEHTSADPQRKNVSVRVEEEEEVRKSSGPRAIAIGFHE